MVERFRVDGKRQFPLRLGTKHRSLSIRNPWGLSLILLTLYLAVQIPWGVVAHAQAEPRWQLGASAAIMSLADADPVIELFRREGGAMEPPVRTIVPGLIVRLARRTSGRLWVDVAVSAFPNREGSVGRIVLMTSGVHTMLGMGRWSVSPFGRIGILALERKPVVTHLFRSQEAITATACFCESGLSLAGELGATLTMKLRDPLALSASLADSVFLYGGTDESNPRYVRHNFGIRLELSMFFD